MNFIITDDDIAQDLALLNAPITITLGGPIGPTLDQLDVEDDDDIEAHGQWEGENRNLDPDFNINNISNVPAYHQYLKLIVLEHRYNDYILQARRVYGNGSLEEQRIDAEKFQGERRLIDLYEGIDPQVNEEQQEEDMTIEELEALIVSYRAQFHYGWMYRNRETYSNIRYKYTRQLLYGRPTPIVPWDTEDPWQYYFTYGRDVDQRVQVMERWDIQWRKRLDMTNTWEIKSQRDKNITYFVVRASKRLFPNHEEDTIYFQCTCPQYNRITQPGYRWRNDGQCKHIRYLNRIKVIDTNETYHRKVRAERRERERLDKLSKRYEQEAREDIYGISNDNNNEEERELPSYASDDEELNYFRQRQEWIKRIKKNDRGEYYYAWHMEPDEPMPFSPGTFYELVEEKEKDEEDEKQLEVLQKEFNKKLELGMSITTIADENIQKQKQSNDNNNDININTSPSLNISPNININPNTNPNTSPNHSLNTNTNNDNINEDEDEEMENEESEESEGLRIEEDTIFDFGD